MRRSLGTKDLATARRQRDAIFAECAKNAAERDSQLTANEKQQDHDEPDQATGLSLRRFVVTMHWPMVMSVHRSLPLGWFSDSA